MAAVTHGVSTASTSNVGSYASGSFTPAANDLCVVFVTATNTVLASPTLVDSVGGTYTRFITATKAGDRLYVFVGNQLAAATARTVTFDCTADPATGCVIQVARVSGLTRTGVSAVLQAASVDNQLAGGTPAVSFGLAVQTGNPTLGLVGNATNPATMTTPTSWTERNDTGYGSPTTGAEYVSRDSGFTGTTITWGSTSSSGFAAIIVELDASAVAGGQPIARRWSTIPYVGGRKVFGGGSHSGGSWG